jgi:hypothetical protein
MVFAGLVMFVMSLALAASSYDVEHIVTALASFALGATTMHIIHTRMR